MGGTALKHLGFESRRISKEEYLEIVFEIREIGRKHFSAFYDILHYTSKPDHGDIDFVCLDPLFGAQPSNVECKLDSSSRETRDEAPLERTQSQTPPAAVSHPRKDRYHPYLT